MLKIIDKHVSTVTQNFKVSEKSVYVFPKLKLKTNKFKIYPLRNKHFKLLKCYPRDLIFVEGCRLLTVNSY